MAPSSWQEGIISVNAKTLLKIAEKNPNPVDLAQALLRVSNTLRLNNLSPFDRQIMEALQDCRANYHGILSFIFYHDDITNRKTKDMLLTLEVYHLIEKIPPPVLPSSIQIQLPGETRMLLENQMGLEEKKRQEAWLPRKGQPYRITQRGTLSLAYGYPVDSVSIGEVNRGIKEYREVHSK